MNVRAALSALLLLALALPAVPRPARADGPWLPAPGEYAASLEASVFSSDSYRNALGDRTPLNGLWEQRALMSSNELGWRKRTSVILSVPFVSVTARDGGSFQHTNTGLADVRVGLRRAILRGPTALSFQADWRAPLGYDRHTSLIGSGLQSAEGRLLGGLPLLKRGFAQGAVGWRYTYFPSHHDKSSHRTLPSGETVLVGESEGHTSWANALTASADLGYWVHRAVLVGGRYQGYLTQSHGSLVPDLTAHLLGPVLLYRVDDRLDLLGGSWSTASAKNTLHYDQFYVAVTFKQTGLDRLQGFLGGSRQP